MNPSVRSFGQAIVATLLFSVAPTLAQAQATAVAADSVGGRWALLVVTPGETFTCKLDMAGPSSKLVGSLDCPKGRVDIGGRADGNRFHIGFQIANGDSISYEGVVSRDTVRGTWREPSSSGSFLGLRGDRAPNRAAPRSHD